VPSTGALCFHDAPADPCLAGGNPDLRAKYCGGNSAEPGAALLFSTALVGVNQAYPEGQVLKQWTWLDNFNGTADGFIVILSNPGGVDPGSGSGGVTITSIDGVLLTNIPSTQIATTASGLAYSRANQTFNGSVEITNISGSTISAPSNGFFQVLFTSLPIGVTLSNASGAFNGSPFITISALARLTPGQSAIVNVQFKNSSAQPINFTPMIYTGRF